MNKVIDLDEIKHIENKKESLHSKQIKSKTRLKKDILEITDFGKTLIDLNNEQLTKLPMPENVYSNIAAAKNMQKIAFKRQVRHIGKLLRKLNNFDEVKESYNDILNKDKKINLLFCRIENICNELLNINKSSQTLDKLIADVPNINVQQLRQLIRNYHKETETIKLKKSYREIFNLLKTYML